MCIEDLLGRIADVLAEGNEINQKRLELCKELLTFQKEQRAKVPRSKAPKSQKTEESAKVLPVEPATVKTDALQELTEEAKTEPEKPVAEQSFKAFESREELRTACRELLSNPGKATEGECAAATEVYSRYGRCLDEIPQVKWGEFYSELKKAFDEVHANA